MSDVKITASGAKIVKALESLRAEGMNVKVETVPDRRDPGAFPERYDIQATWNREILSVTFKAGKFVPVRGDGPETLKEVHAFIAEWSGRWSDVVREGDRGEIERLGVEGFTPPSEDGPSVADMIMSDPGAVLITLDGAEAIADALNAKHAGRTLVSDVSDAEFYAYQEATERAAGTVSTPDADAFVSALFGDDQRSADGVGNGGVPVAPVKVKRTRKPRVIDPVTVVDAPSQGGTAQESQRLAGIAPAPVVKESAPVADAPAVPVADVATMTVRIGSMLNRWGAVAERTHRLTDAERVKASIQLAEDFRVISAWQADADGAGTSLGQVDADANKTTYAARKMIRHFHAVILPGRKFAADRLTPTGRRAFRAAVAPWRAAATAAQ